MKKRRKRFDSSVWMALPLYIFTIVFVVCPLIYMVALSFATPSRYSGTGISEYICRIFETGVYQYDCDCTDRLSVRVLHGKITGAPKKESAASVVHTILGEFTDPSVWLDHHPAEKRTFKFCIDKAWDH